MKSFTEGDRIKIKGRKFFHYGTLHTLKASHAKSEYYRANWPVFEDFVAEQKRRGGGDLAFVTQEPVCIVACPDARAQIKARQDACVEVVDGERVTIDGQPMTVKFIGDYATIIHLN